MNKLKNIPKLRRQNNQSKQTLFGKKPKPPKIITQNILCLGPNGKVENFKYKASIKSRKRSRKNINLNTLASKLHEQKINMFNDFVDKFASSINNNNRFKIHFGSPKFSYKHLKNSKSLEQLQSGDIDEKSNEEVEREDDLLFEEVNWNKKHINKGESVILDLENKKTYFARNIFESVKRSKFFEKAPRHLQLIAEYKVGGNF
jgi:hypothetical protein